MDLNEFAKSLKGYRWRMIDIVLEAIEKNQEAILKQREEEGYWSSFDLGVLGLEASDLELVNGYLSQYRLKITLERHYVYGYIEDRAHLHW